MTAIAYFAGLFCGAFATIAVMSILIIAKRADERTAEVLSESERDALDKHFDERV